MLLTTRWLAATVALGFSLATSAVMAEDAAPSGEGEQVSYYKQIRPIFQAHCQGCHQPAKPSGEFVMTAFDRLFKGGESGEAAVVPGKPDESNLVAAITPVDGTAYMPKEKEPLAAPQIELVRRWIAQGAVDDTPANARQRYDMDHPPVYTRPPVITALDFSPDGQLLAVAGFHEVLLTKADGSELVARLVGVAERIETVQFSPDGTRLLVVGGLPGRMGEIQVWDVAGRKLSLSVPVTYDTIYGGSWSPDGKRIAFGCSDNTVRAIDAATGEQVLYQGAHTDWVRDTAFSKEGTHVLSVDRDGTVKLTEVATQRFIDNVTSITPGALKGGIASIDRHPKLDHFVAGGSDGTPRVYRIFREAKRVIGDDANLIFELFPMTGRVTRVAFSADGRRIAAASALDGAGEILICTYDYDADVPKNILDIMGKVPGSRNAEQNKALDEFKKQGVKLLAKVPLPKTGTYGIAFHPSGNLVAAAGSDGVVRLIDANSGAITKEFSPAPLSDMEQASKLPELAQAQSGQVENLPHESLPEGAKLIALQVQPAEIKLAGPFDYAQILVSGTLESGDVVDVTRSVEAKLSADIATASRSGLVRPKADGQATLQLTLAGQTASVPVTVGGQAADYQADFIRDVAPVLSKLGCNQGTCHGSAKGKNGFKLSLRGYDPIFDVRALTDDLASRRVNLASPDDSLMLLKSTSAVPHTGGAVIQTGDIYYQILRNWIAGGARLDLAVPRVTKIELFPSNPVVQQIGAKQQMRVLATYSDGRVRDVTREAFVESGNTETAVIDRDGLMTSVRRGEAPVLARYEGAYSATILTVMGDRTGFVWQQPETWGRVDELVANKWERLKIQPSELCSDAEFLRRVYLDLTGLPPTVEQVRAFLADTRDTRTKRDELIDKLVGSEEYVEYWTNKWADLLQVNRKFLGTEGAAAFRQWIRGEVAANTPYDQFVEEILTASGSNRENPAASYYKILREPVDMMENTTHLFLGVRFNCNKCHDHPFERWTQDQYYETAAYFARVGLKADPESGKRKIGGTAVEGAKPLYEIVYDKTAGEVVHDRTREVAPPEFPYETDYAAAEDATRREELAAWITSPDNQYFAKSYVNRLWGYMLGVGIMEPIDDIRAGNPPTNPELLKYLTDEFLRSGFDAQHIIKLICKSRTYQLSIATNRWNEDDKTNYSHATPRRLPAEVLLDTIYQVTGSVLTIPGVPAGTRAAELPDSGVELPSGFLNKFGRPARESACECERSDSLQLGPVMALVSGPTLSNALSDPNNALAKLVAQEPDNAKVVGELFLRILNRPAQGPEVQAMLAIMQQIDGDHQKLVQEMQEREKVAAEIHARLEQERQQAIAQAKTGLEAYEKELAPKLAEQETQRQALIAQREAELKAYEATIPAKLPAFEAKYAGAPGWTVLAPLELKASTGATLTKEADGAVLAAAKDGPVVYTVTAETDLKGITGITLEALSDDRLPSKGPGLSPNGNFVLTEFELKAAPKSDPKKQQAVKLENAVADFNQTGYDIQTAIDGKRPAASNGWAVSGQTGQSHTATFEVKDALGFDGGTVLTFALDQRYTDKKHALGKFRLSITTAPKPVGPGLPAEVAAVLAVAADQRSDAQKAALLKFYRQQDEELKKHQQALAEAQKPLPVDPKLQALRQTLEQAGQPVPEDARLARLRRDVQTSEQQLANRRLTAAQDVAWALINSPEFLFNH